MLYASQPTATPTASPTPDPTATPTVEPPTPTATSAPEIRISAGSVEAAFIAGFNGACRPAVCGLLGHALIMVGGPSAACRSGESGWDVYANNGRDLGLAQFDPATWQSVGGGNIYDPFLQGDHVAVMLNRGRQGEWSCW